MEQERGGRVKDYKKTELQNKQKGKEKAERPHICGSDRP